MVTNFSILEALIHENSFCLTFTKIIKGYPWFETKTHSVQLKLITYIISSLEIMFVSEKNEIMYCCNKFLDILQYKNSRTRSSSNLNGWETLYVFTDNKKAVGVSS